MNTFGVNLPTLGPSMMAPTRATTPPDRWTTPDPAKSWKALEILTHICETWHRYEGIRLTEPASAPGPVGVDGVDHPRHQDAEQDVAVKIAALGDGSRDDCGAGGGKGALRLLLSVFHRYFLRMELWASRIASSKEHFQQYLLENFSLLRIFYRWAAQ